MELNGQAIREVRKAKGITREQLAVLTGVSITTISRIERGEGDPGAGTVATIAHILEVSVESLFISTGEQVA